MYEDDDDAQEEHSFDIDTLPTRRAIRRTLKKVVAQSLKLTAEKILDARENDDVAHATDSTTRKKVGCYAPQGIHINSNKYPPPPPPPPPDHNRDNRKCN